MWLQVPKEVIEEKERGQILLRFCYLSHQKVLKVGIEKATILPSTGSRCANPYVTWYVSSYGRVCTGHIMLLLFLLRVSGPSCALDSVHILCSHLESGTSSMKLKTKTVLQSLLPVFSEVRVCLHFWNTTLP